jgi:hypothetical protein
LVVGDDVASLVGGGFLMDEGIDRLRERLLVGDDLRRQGGRRIGVIGWSRRTGRVAHEGHRHPSVSA